MCAHGDAQTYEKAIRCNKNQVSYFKLFIENAKDHIAQNCDVVAEMREAK